MDISDGDQALVLATHKSNTQILAEYMEKQHGKEWWNFGGLTEPLRCSPPGENPEIWETSFVYDKTVICTEKGTSKQKAKELAAGEAIEWLRQKGYAE